MASIEVYLQDDGPGGPDREPAYRLDHVHSPAGVSWTRQEVARSLVQEFEAGVLSLDGPDFSVLVPAASVRRLVVRD